MTQDWTLEEALAYYRRQGAPGEQGALVALLREVQEERGGALPAADLAEIAAALSLRDTFLSAIIRRYPGLRTEEAPTAWSCAAAPAAPAGARPVWPPLWRDLRRAPGGVSASGRFTYRITGCMKNCPNGPSLRWDGALHSRADEALIRALVDEGGGRPSP
ncbi:MAG: NAD(P)H-dependent oxidoreductase subunit E [Flavonifractor plautii]